MEISPKALRFLVSAADGDAALLYLWQCAHDASLPCPLQDARLSAAQDTLRRLGLEASKTPPMADHRPQCTEDAVCRNLADGAFCTMVGEAQRLLGRILSTEELKSLLSLQEYLRLPEDVVSLVISFCVQRARDRGVRMPSLRTVEKEAYRWVDMGIDNVPAAIAYMQKEKTAGLRRGAIARILQLNGRRLTDDETAFIDRWLQWGFGEAEVKLAYEKTCLNTGGLKWPYLNAILKSWQEKGLLTVDAIRQGDGSGKTAKQDTSAVSSLQREAVRRLMESGEG